MRLHYRQQYADAGSTPDLDLMRMVPRCVSMMRPTMARPSPVPLAFVVLKTAVNARFCNSVAHALAGVLEFHRDMRWPFTGARLTNRAELDGERAAIRHRLGGVENQIQKCLFQLRRIAHHQRQVRLQFADQPDVLVGQLVPHQQSEFVNQFVQIHRRKFRFRRAREVQNLLHDFVQVLDFRVNDPGVLRARVAVGKFQIQRVIQQLHHRERIADFVRDLGGEQAERGQFFVLPQLLLHVHDALVKPRLFNRNGRQFRQRAQNADFLVGKIVRPAGINIQRADGLAGKQQRHAQQ